MEDLLAIKERYDTLNVSAWDGAPEGFSVYDCWIRRFMTWELFLKYGPLQKQIWMEYPELKKGAWRLFPELYDLIISTHFKGEQT
jgi:hypothetical protein